MTIRQARASDAVQIAEIYAPYVRDTAISFEDVPPTENELAARIAARWPMHPWLIEEDQAGRIAGYAYAAPYRERRAYQWVCDVSVYVRGDAQGGGVGRRLYGRLFDLLIAQGYTAAYGGMTLPNPASAALHERFGFERFAIYEHVGFKLGAWRSVGWWRRDLAPRQTPQPDIIPLTELHL
ncbi:MAG: N-acetyltransferase family protein [Pseudomonadota bacterium]